MPTIPLEIKHPTDSDLKAFGDADSQLTLRDLCLDLQKGAWLAPEVSVTAL